MWVCENVVQTKPVGDISKSTSTVMFIGHGMNHGRLKIYEPSKYQMAKPILVFGMRF
jgi:hypothetical protein